jgi:hypothetical protein
VVQWHTPQKEVGGGADSLQLARVGQLPQLLTQQKEEEKQMEQELEVLRQDYDRKLVTRHKVRETNSYTYFQPFFIEMPGIALGMWRSS